QEKAPYDPLKDFQTVSLIAKIPTLLVVPSSLNVKTFEDFKTYLAQNGNKVSWAAPGIGTAPHMTGTVLMDAMDSEAQVVHYRGSAPIHTDLVSARIHFTTDSVIAIKPHIESGAVVPVAAVGH